MPEPLETRDDNQENNDHPDLRELFVALSETSGLDYFQCLAETVCTYLDMDSAFIAVLDEAKSEMKTVGTVWNGEPADSIRYSYEGTPCSVTLADGFCFYASDVVKAFPNDQMLIDEEIEAYIGHAIKDTTGKTIGSVVAISKTPIKEEKGMDGLPRMLIARTRAELQNYLMSEKLKETLSEALLLNYSKSMFMANISHELRNPLSAMIGYASLIRDRQVEAKDAVEYAGEICLAGEELLTLIGDILSLSSLEMSGENVERIEFDLTDIARTGRRLQQEQAAAKNLTILPVNRTEPVCVIGDPVHTKKALLNILSNAVKYTSLGEIEISVDINTEGEAVLSVRDTGVGMSAEQIEKVSAGMGNFERAYTMHQDGAELGFPLTYLLIERQGGRIEVESQPAMGTTVKLIFPKSLVVETPDDFI